MSVVKTGLNGLVGVLVSLSLQSVIAYPSIFPTGTTIYKPAKSYSSYILVSDHASLGNHPSAKTRTKSVAPDDVRLIDMNGNVVHKWLVKPYFNKRSRLLANGKRVYLGPDKTLYEYNWEGDIVWSHKDIDSVNDMRVLANNKWIVPKISNPKWPIIYYGNKPRKS